jgi:3-oxoacyl-[acyl-carrier-protein] synthase-3
MGMKMSYYLPPGQLDNHELSKLYQGWTEDKILSKTGIASRHIAGLNETALDLAEKAAQELLATHGISAEQIDFILLCTQSPDYKLPSSACILQDRLGIPTSAGALGLDLGCSGFIYGLALAKGLVIGGMARNVLLVTSETYSKYINPMDKSVRTIFGDGAAACFVDEALAVRIGQFVFGTDGSGADKLIVKTGGARTATVANAATENDAFGNMRTINDLYMNGAEIFNFTLDIVPPTMDEVCAKNCVTRNDVDLFVFHQANKFMLDTIRKTNGIPRDKFYVNLTDTGNTVSSTIPIALVRAEAEGRLKPGMKVMVMGFGVGLSWGATILQF